MPYLKSGIENIRRMVSNTETLFLTSFYNN